MWEDIFWIEVDTIKSKYTHMANPFPILIEDTIRIFYNGRDKNQKSYILSVDFDMSSLKMISVHPEIIIGPGKQGEFDDCGCSMGCVAMVNGKILLYYLGWNLSNTVPFRNAIGVVELDNSLKVVKRYRGPIIDRSLVNPLSLSYPYVLESSLGDVRMWYGSHIEWGEGVADMIHTMKLANSEDGISWQIEDIRCLVPDEETMAFSRPFVKLVDGVYHMWYSYRGDKYKIGYAISKDGVLWNRHDKYGGLEATPESVNKSEMVCYPGLFDYKGVTYMLYNGDGYGITGIGLTKQTKMLLKNP